MSDASDAPHTPLRAIVFFLGAITGALLATAVNLGRISNQLAKIAEGCK